MCKLCILFHCQASQTEISKPNSATLCQTVNGKWRQQSAVKKFGVVYPEKHWGQKLLHLLVLMKIKLIVSVCYNLAYSSLGCPLSLPISLAIISKENARYKVNKYQCYLRMLHNHVFTGLLILRP